MVFLDPQSIAFSLGPLDVRWYGVFAAIMFLGVYLAVPWLAKRKWGDDDTTFWQNVVVVALVSGLIGARLLHVIVAWEYYSSRPLEAFAIWKGGLTTHGALITGFLGLWWYARRHGRHVLDLTDVFVVPFAFALALGRVGNIMNQEILGDPCPGPWPGCGPLTFEFGSDPEGLARHPVQLYAIGKNLITGTVVALLFLSTKTRGIASAAFLSVYGTLRFIVEFYRDEPLFLGPFDLVQVFATPVVLGAIVWLVVLLLKERRVEEGEPDAS